MMSEELLEPVLEQDPDEWERHPSHLRPNGWPCRPSAIAACISTHWHRYRRPSAVRTPISTRWLLALIFGVVGPLTGILHAHDMIVFLLNAAALLPMALLLAEVVEKLAHLSGDVFGGLVSVTMSNTVEMVIALLAIHKGFVRFVQVTLLGSVLTGSLLLPGVCFVARAFVRLKRQRFNKPAVRMNSLLLLLAVMSVAVPCAYNATTYEKRRWECAHLGKPRYCTLPSVVTLSRLIAVILLGCYVTMLVWSTLTHSYLLRKKKVKPSPNSDHRQRAPPHTHTDSQRASEQQYGGFSSSSYVALPSPSDGSIAPTEEDLVAEAIEVDADVQNALLMGDERTASFSGHVPTESMDVRATVVLAAGLTLWLAVCAEFLLEAVDGAAALLHLTRHFVALVVIPNIGNIDAITASASMALKGKMDLALTLALGSAVQVSLGLMPVLVIICAFVGEPLHFDLRGLETVVLLLSTLVVNAVVRTATSTYLEGSLMIGGYLVVACAYAVRSNEDDSNEAKACVCGEWCCSDDAARAASRG